MESLLDNLRTAIADREAPFDPRSFAHETQLRMGRRFRQICRALNAGRCGIYETRPRGCRAFDCSREPG